MRIGICGDVHWSTTSSILQQRGEVYSLRLENLIQSVSWFENLTKDCDSIVYLGDFFDKSDINAECLTALNDIVWNDRPKTFLVGNHETNRSDLQFSSAHILNIKGESRVIDKPVHDDGDEVTLCYLPYILPNQMKSVGSYFPNVVKPKIIFSHNDISGIQYGRINSKEGFDIHDIEKNCSRFINGHLHNGSKISARIINVGNLTGQNFSEDAFNYDHVVLILDTKTLECEVYENPYAFKFYKLDFTENDSIEYINSIKLKRNAIVTVKCRDNDSYECIRSRFDANYSSNGFPKNCNVIASRFVIVRDSAAGPDDKDELIAVDHITQFENFIRSNLGTNEIVEQELLEVCRQCG